MFISNYKLKALVDSALNHLNYIIRNSQSFIEILSKQLKILLLPKLSVQHEISFSFS